MKELSIATLKESCQNNGGYASLNDNALSRINDCGSIQIYSEFRYNYRTAGQ